jgi:hypothetical protein
MKLVVSDGSELPIPGVKNQIKERRDAFPVLLPQSCYLSVIASHSQLEERTQKLLLNGIV